VSESESKVIELRQYTLKPGQRDVLIELFEREFIESQEALGMEIVGTFRDADDPDRFVWLRTFPDMEARAQSLAAFYGGPVWKAHRDVANATMLDSDNVLLLRPAWESSDFPSGRIRAPVGATETPTGLVTASIYYFDQPVPDKTIAAFREALPSAIEASAARFLGAFVTESSRNTFPALPVREGENVLVWFAALPNPASTIDPPPELVSTATRVEQLRLQPTARSKLMA
jgi:hypothetical protein